MALPTPQSFMLSNVGRVTMCARAPNANPALRAPFLIHLAVAGVDSYTDHLPDVMYNNRGWSIGSIDPPGHGEDVRFGEDPTNGLVNWAERIRHDEDIVFDQCQRLRMLIQHLINDEIAAAGRIAISGRSRGGWMALHALACLAQIKAGVALFPVTDLGALSEFAEVTGHWLRERYRLGNALLERKNVFLTMSLNDTRVSTQLCLENVSQIVSRAGTANAMEVHIAAAPLEHMSPPGMEDKAADWLYGLVT